MIIDISIGNYRSFGQLQSLNFRATGLSSEDKCVDEINTIPNQMSKILKILGIYGPNASGKSNLIKGLTFLKEMVMFSQESEDFLNFTFNPFRFAELPPDQYGYFQIILLLNNRKYRYGFTLNINRNIDSEWLFGPAEKNETKYFTRNRDEISIAKDHFKNAIKLPYKENLRKDTLFLSFASSFDVEVARTIRDFIANRIFIEGFIPFNQVATIGSERQMTDQLIKSGKKDIVLKWLAEAGMPFKDVALRDVELGNIRYGHRVILTKPVLDAEANILNYALVDLERDESDGTRKYYNFIGGLYEVFEKGGIFVSDEIDSNFHPSLLIQVIRLFQDSAVNKTNAQLLFTSHDTNLMNPELMRRDQFYFTEKNRLEQTTLYSLADLRGIRNNSDFARQYLAGYYGALPQLGAYLNAADHDTVIKKNNCN